MPSAESSFDCRGKPEAIAALLVDPAFLASTIPGIIGVELLGPHEANWSLEIRQGPITRRTTLRGRYDRENDGSIRFSAEGGELSLTGRVWLRAADTETTRVTVGLEYEGRGPLRYIINNLLRKALNDYPNELRAKLESRLQGPAPAPSA